MAAVHRPALLCARAAAGTRAALAIASPLSAPWLAARAAQALHAGRSGLVALALALAIRCLLLEPHALEAHSLPAPPAAQASCWVGRLAAAHARHAALNQTADQAWMQQRWTLMLATPCVAVRARPR